MFSTKIRVLILITVGIIHIVILVVVFIEREVVALENCELNNALRPETVAMLEINEAHCLPVLL